ncbi:MAG TPA: glycosyltransferase family 39 protein [Oligoflexia bacterium]|nr:glycosyltransferase family 39 protein [Oligoflexia bacterium]
MPFLARVENTCLKDLAALFFWTLVLSAYGLGSLEFLRHTEADRTLISWEMLERGNYLVPHLLGSEILTKPPLYYWFSAGMMKLLASHAEWAARAPSVFAACCFVLVQYLFVLRITYSRSAALLSGFFLSTSFALFVLSASAELDLLYGFLSAASLYCLYLALTLRSFFWTLAAYAVLAAAFLAKGPPVVIFFAAVAAGFAPFLQFGSCKSTAAGPKRSLAALVICHAAGVLLFCFLVLLWLYPVIKEVGYATLLSVSRVEFAERALFPARLPRSRLFYVFDFFGGLLPWSLLLAVLLRGWICEKRAIEKNADMCVFSREFVLFNILAVVLPLLLLSFSEAKAGRYSFPVQAFGINLCAGAAFLLGGTAGEKRLYQFCSILALIIAFGALPAVLFVSIDGVNRGSFIVCALVSSLAGLLLLLASLSKRPKAVLAAIGFLVFSLRVSYAGIYAPHRNAVRSVRPIAAEIDQILPQGTPLYTIELFERWVGYYLKRLGRTTLRLTPVNCAELEENKDGVVFLLLNAEEELWRLELLQELPVQVRELRRFRLGRNKGVLVLMEVSAAGACALRPQKIFPTAPTKPFWPKVAR